MLLDIAIKLIDFNDLYVIAAGLSMAYICLETKDKISLESYAFLKFIYKIIKIFQDGIVYSNKNKKGLEEFVITRAEYAIESGKLNESTKGAISLICTKAREGLAEYIKIEEDAKVKFAYHTKTDFLHVISFNCFIYSMSLLYFGALEEKQIYTASTILIYASVLIIISSLYCYLADRFDKWSHSKLFKPRKIWSFVIWIALFVIAHFTKGMFCKLTC